VTNPPLTQGSSTADISSSARPHIAPTISAQRGLTPAGWFLAGLALFIFLACSSGGVTSGSGGVPSGGGTTAPPGPGSSAADPAPLGTEVTPAKGWPVKVNSANLDADADVAKAARYMTPSPGNKYVAVDITTTNGTGRPAAIGTGVTLKLLGSSGVAHDRAYLTQYPKELDTMAQLQPGVTVSGMLVFEVPADEIPSLVLLAEPLLTLDENEDQRFLALK
jgi:hypothetical protein